MGFKMRRSGMSLRSTTRIQPQLTNLQSNQGSPLRQEEEGIVGAEFNPTTSQETDSGNVSGQRSRDGRSSLYGKIIENRRRQSKWRSRSKLETNFVKTTHV